MQNLPTWDELVPPEGGDDGEARRRYLRSCTRYLQRQLLVYKNWPQRAFDPMGYRDEKVFRDQNA